MIPNFLMADVKLYSFRFPKKKGSYLRTFWTRIPATTPIVVGKLAAHTPSLFKVFSSMLAATTRGGAHYQGI